MTIKFECSSANIVGTVDGTVIVTLDIESDTYAAEIASVLNQLGHGALLAKVCKVNDDIARWNNARNAEDKGRREWIEQDLRDTADALLVDTPQKPM